MQDLNWERLSPIHRKYVLWYLRFLYTQKILTTAHHLSTSTIRFTLRSGLLTLLTLGLMPLHPMAIPAALGSGLSISILIQCLPQKGK